MKSITSLVFVFGAIGSFISGFVNDWLVKRKGLVFGRRMAGTVSLSGAAILFFYLSSTSNNSAAVFCLCATQFFISFNSVSAFSACVDIGGNHVGTITGVMNTAGQSSGFFIGMIVGAMVHASHSYTSSLLMVAVVFTFGAAMWLLVDPTKKLVAEVQEVKSNLIVAI